VEEEEGGEEKRKMRVGFNFGKRVRSEDTNWYLKIFINEQ
jgi:hypothetical protein